MTAKILLLDIETAPILGWAWTKYDTNLIEIQEPFFILSFAWKFLDDQTVSVRGLVDYPDYNPEKHNDKSLITDLHSLLDQADIVVAHNGDSFDIKKANARFLYHGLKPPSTYKTVDTLKAARKHFKFDSNKLNDLCKTLGVGGKVPHTGFALWKACMAGDVAAWEVMKEYNAHDVTLLEEIYLRLRPWITHPDVNLYRPVVERDVHTDHTHSCPNCGSSHIQRRGIAVARTRRYRRLNCQDCGSWFTGDVEK